jgi:hypothetical protein
MLIATVFIQLTVSPISKDFAPLNVRFIEQVIVYVLLQEIDFTILHPLILSNLYKYKHSEPDVFPVFAEIKIKQ